MRVKNFTVLITSALMLSASLFLAPAAFAEGDVCPEVDGWSSHAFPSDGDISVTGGTLTFSNNDLTLSWTIADGYTLDLCVKSGSDAGFDNPDPGTTPPGSRTTILGIEEAGSLTITKKISHISYRFNLVPSDVTATASIGDVACEETSVALTLGSDGTSDFTASVDGTAISVAYTSVSGAGNNEALDLSSLADGDYTVRVASPDLAADVTKVITIDSECEEPAVASAAVAGSCDTLSAAVDVTGNEGDEFTVSLNGTVIDTIVLDATGAASESYALPENAVSTVTVGGAAADASTIDCTVEVDPNIIEKEDPPVVDDEVDPAVDDKDDVEVKPRVLERDELPRTGDTEDRMLVIALTLMGLGLPLTLAKPKAQRVDLA